MWWLRSPAAAAGSARLQRLLALQHALRAHNTAATAGVLEVCAIDPLLVLEPARLAAAAAAAASTPGTPAAYVSIQVPFRLLAQLNGGQMELAEHDDPGNTWHFGRRAELFQLHFEGRHRVESGFTSLVLGDTVRGLERLGGGDSQRASRKQAALSEQSWLAFLQHIKGGTGEGLWPTPSLPFLFAGVAIDCASVGVYTLPGEGGGGIQGLALHSEYDTPGAD